MKYFFSLILMLLAFGVAIAVAVEISPEKEIIFQELQFEKYSVSALDADFDNNIIQGEFNSNYRLCINADSIGSNFLIISAHNRVIYGENKGGGTLAYFLLNKPGIG